MQCGMGNDCHERRRLNELNAANDHYPQDRCFGGADTDPHKE